MVGTLGTLRYFHREGEDFWRAYRDDTGAEVCGERQISYNRDEVSDFVPSGGTVHGPCAEKLREDREPKAEPKRQRRGPAK